MPVTISMLTGEGRAWLLDQPLLGYVRRVRDQLVVCSRRGRWRIARVASRVSSTGRFGVGAADRFGFSRNLAAAACVVDPTQQTPPRGTPR